MNTKTIIEQAGGAEAVAQKVGVKTPYAVRVQYGDKLPASWYVALCEMTGETLPVGAFSFKGLDA